MVLAQASVRSALLGEARKRSSRASSPSQCAASRVHSVSWTSLKRVAHCTSFALPKKVAF